jgi:hypothetical protein
VEELVDDEDVTEADEGDVALSAVFLEVTYSCMVFVVDTGLRVSSP